MSKKELYDSSLKKCQACDVALSYKQRFNKYCSSSCAATVNNSKFPKRRRNSSQECMFCQTSLIGKAGKKYCSLTCQGAYRAKQRIDLWLSNSSTGGTAGVVCATVRLYIHQKQDGCCKICGIDTWMGLPVGLVMDHINGNSDDHAEENLRLICSNCDMQLPTYKSKNRGNGRAYRRERYASGQSY